MARKQKNLARTAVAVAATALLEKAVQKAAEDPRVRRKVKSVAKTLKKRAKAAGKKLTQAIKKRAPKLGRATAARRRKRVNA
jgi:hypothetical protein